MFSKADLRRLIIPLMIEQALALSVGMIDTAMVASAGEGAMSGVSLVESINILVINLFASISSGGAIVAAQYLGRNDSKNGNHAAKQLILASFLLSVIFMVICAVFHRAVLTLVFGDIEAEVMLPARTYFLVTAISYPFIALYNAAAALFRSMGSSKLAMINSFIMNIINIIGNSIFIFGFGWGVFGAALSTLISRIIAAVTMLLMLRNKGLKIHVDSYRFRDFDSDMIRRILKIGIPNGLENSMFQIGKIVVTSLVAQIGTVAIAAHAVAGSLVGLEVIPGFALALALTTIVAQCAGANEFEQAKYYIKYLMKQSYLYIIILNMAILLLLKPILHLFQLSEPTFEMAYILMLIHTIGVMIIWPASFTLPNAFRASGDVRFSMLISIFSMWAFRIGGSYFLVAHTELGVISIWLAMQVDWVFRSICFIWRYFSGKWKRQILD